MLNPVLYDTANTAAAHARRRDDDFFARNPKAILRVRPLLEGESPMVSGTCALQSSWRGYAIVIDHARAKDRRARHGRIIYPVAVRISDKQEARWIATQEGARWAKWFRKHSTTPPPMRGAAFVM